MTRSTVSAIRGSRLFRASIWAPGAIPASEGQLARDLKRVILPLYDLGLIVCAVLALRGGLPSFAIVYPLSVSQFSSVALLLIAVLCLVGISFPHLWKLEAISKSALLAFQFSYAIVLFGLSVENPARGYVGGLAFVLMILPIWRLVILRRERKKRDEEERAERLVRDARAILEEGDES